jgi:hypothetical protein
MGNPTIMDSAGLLRAYDEQLRTDAEVASALVVQRYGPLYLAAYEGGRGFVTYRDLGSADVDDLVTAALAHYRPDLAIEEIEWKTRAHDRAPGLHEALTGHGFVPDEPESIMIGEAAALTADVPLPDGVTLRRVSDEPDVRAMCEMQDIAFGHTDADRMTPELLRRLRSGVGLELWVAQAEGRIVSAGRLELVEDSDFAGVWGGATLHEWRGRGIYRALIAARARSALARGKTLIHSDSTEYSRPILERSGLVRVSTTTPYVWRRPAHDLRP